MNSLDLSKQDKMVVYGDRTFALRAYCDDGAWHSVIIENRTPIRHGLEPAADAATCIEAAVGFVAAAMDAAGERGGTTR